MTVYVHQSIHKFIIYIYTLHMHCIILYYYIILYCTVLYYYAILLYYTIYFYAGMPIYKQPNKYGKLYIRITKIEMPVKLSSDKEVLRLFKQYYSSATGQPVADPHLLAATPPTPTVPAAATAPSTPRVNDTTASTASTLHSNTTQAAKPSLSRRRSSPSTPPTSRVATTDTPHTIPHTIYTTLKPADLKSFGSVGSSHRTRSGRESTWASDANDFEAEDDFSEFSGFERGFQKFFF